MSDVVFVYITCAGMDQAETIGRALVDERLVACVNLIPGMRSIYRWQGKVETAEEVVVIAKGLFVQVDAITARVKQLHSYTLPCVVAVPVVGGSAEYLEWVRANG